MRQGRGGERQVLKSTFPAGLRVCSSPQRTCQSVKRLVLTIKDEESDCLSVCGDQSSASGPHAGSVADQPE